MSVVEVKNGYKFYGKPSHSNYKIVLNRFNMNVMQGSIYALLGASGCGKTTLLSCIVGQQKLQRGSITVLGVKVSNHASTIKPRIGYMPQDVALPNELTIIETIFYFGRIYGLSDDRILHRLNEFKGLLNLPPTEQLIADLSGGEKRRVSFACVLIHEPELLILDEPTVGLDPILRETIWEFLSKMTSTGNAAVIITTHYIEEARDASMVGLIRNGVLLAEDTPGTIMSSFRCSTLEEAFMILSQKQATSEKDDDPFLGTDNTSELEGNSNLFENRNSGEAKCSFTSWRRMRALLTRNFLQIIRQKAGLVFYFVFPVLQCLCFYAAFGHNPRNLKLGIVNDEVRNYEDCFHKSLNGTDSYDEGKCNLYNSSCQFLNFIPTEVAEQVHFKTIDEAYKAAREEKVIGFIYFAPNFTESLVEVKDVGIDADEGSLTNREIEIRLDMTSQQVAYFVQRKLIDCYNDFAHYLAIDCRHNKYFDVKPIRFQTPIFGAFDAPYIHFVTPIAILTMYFCVAFLGTASLFVTDRADGIWDRTLVAGVSTPELLFAHIFTQSFIVVLQCLEISFYVGLTFDIVNHGSNFTVIAMLILNGFAGMLLGLLISVLCPSHTLVNFITVGIACSTLLLSGAVWPIEFMSVVLKYIALALPSSLPGISVRNVIEKAFLHFAGWSIYHPQVFSGFLTIGIWIVCLSFLCFLSLRKLKQ